MIQTRVEEGRTVRILADRECVVAEAIDPNQWRITVTNLPTKPPAVFTLTSNEPIFCLRQDSGTAQ